MNCLRSPMFVLLFASSLYAQDSNHTLVRAYPISGWKVFAGRIHYPDLAWGAGLQGCAHVQFKIDSSGSVSDSIYVKGSEPIFSDAIRAAIKVTRWHPAMFKGKPVNDVLSFPIHFIIKGEPSRFGVVVQPDLSPVMPKTLNDSQK